jgi:peptide/nickel transport system permease protein
MRSLRAYIITRILLTIPMVLTLLVLVFILLRVMPGDPVLATMRPGAPKEMVDQQRHNLGLDRPMVLNFRGSQATAESQVALYAQHASTSTAVLVVQQGDVLPVSDRYTAGGEDWLLLSIDPNRPVWITQEKLTWVLQQQWGYRDEPGGTPPSLPGTWQRVVILSAGGGVQGWAPAGQFRITTNPFDSQFFNYLWGLISRFDLGTSMTVEGRPIASDLMEKFPATVELSVFGMLVASVVGVFTGALAAQRRRSAADYSLRIYSIVAYAIPIFWLGLMLQLIFGVGLHVLPATGRETSGLGPQAIADAYGWRASLAGSAPALLSILDFFSNFYLFDCIVTGQWGSLLDVLRHLVLPALTLGLYLSGIFTRLTRANMLDVLQQDYILAARARGIRERVVVYSHALKNAFIPILTMFGLQFAVLLGGAVLTETTFSWPGMGLYLVKSIADRDFAAIQGTIVFFALLVALVSLIVDIIYARIDPRVRY